MAETNFREKKEKEPKIILEILVLKPKLMIFMNYLVLDQSNISEKHVK